MNHSQQKTTDADREAGLSRLEQLKANPSPTVADDVARRRIAAALGVDAGRAQVTSETDNEASLKDLTRKLGLTYHPED